jgi:competence protein ComEA
MFMRELWAKHRSTCLFVVGMFCFLAAGLVVASFPPSEKSANLTKTAKLTKEEVQKEVLKEEVLKEETQKGETQAKAAPAPEGAAAPEGTAAPKGTAAERAELTELAPPEEWVIYITGAVRRQGVYRLPAGSRLFQLVEAAGGLNDLADPVAVNMASTLDDGLHVHVPKKGEEKRQFLPNLPFLPSQPSQPVIQTGQGQGQGKVRTRTTASPGGRIDINRASAEELTALKGIGPVLAKNIVEHRSKIGRFRSVEDLLQVKGIGPKKLEALRDSVTLGP